MWLIPFLLCAEFMSTLSKTDSSGFFGIIASEEDRSYQMEERDGQNESQSQIQGIFLTGKSEDVIPEGRPEQTGIQLMDIEIPGGSEALIDRLKPFLGKPVSEETAIAIKQNIIEYYLKNGVTMVGVEVPSQMTEGGVIQFLVLRKRCGQIISKGESFYNSARLSRYLGVTPNQEIADDVLQNNLSWLNKNPFQFNKIRFVDTADPNVLDIEVDSEKRRALRFYVKGDNTGSCNTGYGRLYAGFAWGNAFNRGDILAFEYESSTEFRRFQSWTANYTCFLPWKNIITLYGAYGIVKPSLPAFVPTFLRTHRIIAKAWQIRPRYTIPFRPLYTPLQQSLAFGFDVKNTNSSIVNLAGVNEVVQPASLLRNVAQIYVTQLAASYTLYDTVCRNNYSFNVSFYASPFTWLPHQSDHAYGKVRSHSRPKYCYLNVIAADVIEFCNETSISFLIRGQVASHTLPPTELFCIGGYDTVRGYHEAEVSGDNGFIANFEVRTRQFSAIPRSNGKLSFLAFIDYGLSNNWYMRPTGIPGIKNLPNTQYLLGVGPGLRYAVNPYFQLRLDYGIKLHKLASNSPFLNKLNSGFGQVHIGALASF